MVKTAHKSKRPMVKTANNQTVVRFSSPYLLRLSMVKKINIELCVLLCSPILTTYQVVAGAKYTEICYTSKVSLSGISATIGLSGNGQIQDMSEKYIIMCDLAQSKVAHFNEQSTFTAILHG